MDADQACFAWGVASGDPRQHSVVLWTRTAQPAALRWELFSDAACQQQLQSGRCQSSAEHDHCVHVVVHGLQPGSRYWYRFVVEAADTPDGQAADGQAARSRLGCTQTLPDGTGTGSGAGSSFNLAQVCCARFNTGFFAAYRHIAARSDLQAWLHLGDYIYEIAEPNPGSGSLPANAICRPLEPREECCSLAQYRQRYASYHRDPDLQAVRAALPLIALLDDHDIADNQWRGGAGDHDGTVQGPWSQRRAAALQARSEWLPLRPGASRYGHATIGDLVELIWLDSRTERDQPVTGPAMDAPTRTALGAVQSRWLADTLAASTARWRLLATPSVLVPTWRAALPAALQETLRQLKLMHPSDDAVDEDQWDGYPAERQQLLNGLAAAPPSVVLSGDIHVSVVAQVHQDPADADSAPLAPEFVVPSLSSPNLDDRCGRPRGSAAAEQQALIAHLPHLHWCELDSHGYNVVTIDREAITVSYWHLDDVRDPASSEHCAARWLVRHGDPRPIRLD